ncbi:MAG: hypothetical protein WAL25_03995 [Acidimicrobiia bacterium]
MTLANRICAVGGPQQIHESEVVSGMGTEQGYEFDSGRMVELKGFAQPAVIDRLLGSG